MALIGQSREEGGLPTQEDYAEETFADEDATRAEYVWCECTMIRQGSNYHLKQMDPEPCASMKKRANSHFDGNDLNLETEPIEKTGTRLTTTYGSRDRRIDNALTMFIPVHHKRSCLLMVRSYWSRSCGINFLEVIVVRVVLVVS